MRVANRPAAAEKGTWDEEEEDIVSEKRRGLLNGKKL
jgi:hypothetical protein